MTQLTIALSDQQARELETRAKINGLALEQYVLNVLTATSNGYPAGYFESVAGGWQGKPLEREPQGNLEDRESL